MIKSGVKAFCFNLAVLGFYSVPVNAFPRADNMPTVFYGTYAAYKTKVLDAEDEKPNLEYLKRNLSKTFRLSSAEINRGSPKSPRFLWALSSCEAHSKNLVEKSSNEIKSEVTKSLIAVSNAWVREAPPRAVANAGYMTIINTSDSEIELVSAGSNAFAEVEFHEMEMIDGMMEMREVSGFVIPQGGKLKLEPGGKHLMLKKPNKRLIDGDLVDVSFKFSNGEIQKLTLRVNSDI